MKGFGPQDSEDAGFGLEGVNLKKALVSLRCRICCLGYVFHCSASRMSGCEVKWLCFCMTDFV